MHYIICVSGYSGVGKDEFCHRLVKKHEAIHTGLADPAKRHMADIYGFTRDQLFGPSSLRNAGDVRYPKTSITRYGARPATKDDLVGANVDSTKQYWCLSFQYINAEISQNFKSAIKRETGTDIKLYFNTEDPAFFLSPREALQLYCDLMNTLYTDTWVRKGIEVHKQLALFDDDRPKFIYDRMSGLLPNDGSRNRYHNVITCFSDFRHKHELEYVKSIDCDNMKIVSVRIKHPTINKPPFDHKSETEQSTIPDRAFDFIAYNNRDIEHLHNMADRIVLEMTRR